MEDLGFSDTVFSFFFMPATSSFVLHVFSFFRFFKETLHSMPRCAMFSTLGVNLHEKKCDIYACQTVLFVTFL